MTTALLPREEVGEATSHPGLRIVPTADEAGRYTGDWAVRHIPSDEYVPVRGGLPLPWLRRFGELLASCGIDWSRVPGGLWSVRHPQTTLIRAMERYVVDCWHRGVPVSPGFVVSFSGRSDGRFQLRCTNPRCEDPDLDGQHGDTAVLADYTEDGDAIEVAGEMDEVAETAWGCGWRPVDEHGKWLCATCAVTHQPAPRGGDQ